MLPLTASKVATVHDGSSSWLTEIHTDEPTPEHPAWRPSRPSNAGSRIRRWVRRGPPGKTSFAHVGSAQELAAVRWTHEPAPHPSAKPPTAGRSARYRTIEEKPPSADRFEACPRKPRGKIRVGPGPSNAGMRSKAASAPARGALAQARRQPRPHARRAACCAAGEPFSGRVFADCHPPAFCSVRFPEIGRMWLGVGGLWVAVALLMSRTGVLEAHGEWFGVPGSGPFKPRRHSGHSPMGSAAVVKTPCPCRPSGQPAVPVTPRTRRDHHPTPTSPIMTAVAGQRQVSRRPTPPSEKTPPPLKSDDGSVRPAAPAGPGTVHVR